MASKVTSNSREHFEKLYGEVVKRAEKIGEYVGRKTVDYLRSYTDEMRPPAYLPFRKRKKGKIIKTGPRQAHPGHWADVTNNLKNAHGHEVIVNGHVVEVKVYNNMEYAAELDKREGYSVVGVAFDDGTVEQLAQEAHETVPKVTV